MMGLAVLFSAFFTLGGIAVSYVPGIPAGATIILLAGAVYLLVVAVSYVHRMRNFTS
ncbi:MAG: hypothetical protein BWZ01_02251 [Deltaproteobacteria bacterium ADurb.BinA179]|nr:MAG: hypothetical protein BWZ01_02251 [Deltaproteobacteria bacterium ADurb.BinA179]